MKTAQGPGYKAPRAAGARTVQRSCYFKVLVHRLLQALTRRAKAGHRRCNLDTHHPVLLSPHCALFYIPGGHTGEVLGCDEYTAKGFTGFRIRT